MSQETRREVCFNTPDLSNVQALKSLYDALKNPESAPQKYCAVFYGFCTFCGILTSYGCTDETVLCEKCELSFSESSQGVLICCCTMSHKKEHYYVYRDTIPAELHSQFDQLHSRENQRIKFEICRLALEKKKEQLFDTLNEELNVLDDIRLPILNTGLHKS